MFRAQQNAFDDTVGEFLNLAWGLAGSTVMEDR